MNNHIAYKKEKRMKLPLGVIFFMIPVFILSLIVIIGLILFNPNQEQADALLEESLFTQQKADAIDQYYMLSNGHALSVAYEHEVIQLNEIDLETNQLIQSEQIETDIFHRLFTSYQKNGLVFITKSTNDHNLLAYYYQSGESLVQLEIPPIKVSGFLEDHVMVNGDSIYITGLDESNTYTAFLINEGEAKPISISEDDRIVDLIGTGFYKISSFENMQPILELTLYDRSTYLMGLSPEAENRFLISASQSPWDTELELWTHYFQPGDAAIRLESEKLVRYDILSGNSIDTIQTPQSIYYPELFQLGENLTLVLGRESVNEPAPMVGYLYDVSGENLQIDLTPLLQEVSSHILYTESAFSAQLVDNTLYLSSSDQANVISLEDQRIEYVTNLAFQQTFTNVAYDQENQAEQLLEDGRLFSFNKIIPYFKEDEASRIMGMFIIMWVTVPLTIILTISFFVKRKNRKLQRIYDDRGVMVKATILHLKQTGMYVNEQPQVLMRVRFEHKQKKLEHDVKKVVSLLLPPKIGDKIDLLYDVKTEKVYDVNEKLLHTK